MANYAYCDLIIQHSDPAMIARMVTAYMKGQLFGDYLPCPPELDDVYSFHGDEQDEEKKLRCRTNYEKYGFETAFDWRCLHWGAAWEMGIRSSCSTLTILGETKLKLETSTKWTAPTEVLNHWVKLGYDIEGTIDSDTTNSMHDEYKNGVMRTVIYDREQYEAVFGKIVEEAAGIDCC